MHMQIHLALKSSESMRWFPTGIFSVGEGVEPSFDVAGAVYTDDDSDPVSLRLMFPTVQHEDTTHISADIMTLRNITITLR